MNYEFIFNHECERRRRNLHRFKVMEDDVQVTTENDLYLTQVKALWPGRLRPLWAGVLVSGLL